MCNLHVETTGSGDDQKPHVGIRVPHGTPIAEFVEYHRESILHTVMRFYDKFIQVCTDLEESLNRGECTYDVALWIMTKDIIDGCTIMGSLYHRCTRTFMNTNEAFSTIDSIVATAAAMPQAAYPKP